MVVEYGKVHGELNMMAEIYERGPMACGIDSRLLHFYTGGILVLNNTDPPIHDHLVSIAGWGEENGLKYWIIRNSWVQTKLHSCFCILYPCLSFLAFF
jgi:cathepsin X